MQINTINQYELNAPELHYLSPLLCKACCGIIFEVKSGFKGRKNCSCSGLSDEPVTDELCAGTDWY